MKLKNVKVGMRVQLKKQKQDGLARSIDKYVDAGTCGTVSYYVEYDPMGLNVRIEWDKTIFKDHEFWWCNRKEIRKYVDVSELESVE